MLKSACNQQVLFQNILSDTYKKMIGIRFFSLDFMAHLIMFFVNKLPFVLVLGRKNQKYFHGFLLFPNMSRKFSEKCFYARK